MSESKYVLYVITLGMLCAFAPMCTDMYLPALPSVMVDFNTSTSLVQISLASSLYIGIMYLATTLCPSAQYLQSDNGLS